MTLPYSAGRGPWINGVEASAEFTNGDPALKIFRNGRQRRRRLSANHLPADSALDKPGFRPHRFAGLIPLQQQSTDIQCLNGIGVTHGQRLRDSCNLCKGLQALVEQNHARYWPGLGQTRSELRMPGQQSQSALALLQRTGCPECGERLVERAVLLDEFQACIQTLPDCTGIGTEHEAPVLSCGGGKDLRQRGQTFERPGIGWQRGQTGHLDVALTGLLHGMNGRA